MAQRRGRAAGPNLFVIGKKKKKQRDCTGSLEYVLQTPLQDNNETDPEYMAQRKGVAVRGLLNEKDITIELMVFSHQQGCHPRINAHVSKHLMHGRR